MCASNAVKHGLYSKHYTAADVAFVAGIGNEDEELKSLDSEVMLAKVQLRRAWAAASQVLDKPDMLEITEIRQFSDEFEQVKEEIVRKRPELWREVDRALRTVAQVVAARNAVQVVPDLEALVEEHRSRMPDKKGKR